MNAIDPRDINAMFTLLQSIFNNGPARLFTCIVTAIGSILAPVQAICAVVLCVILLDFYLGCRVSFKYNRKPESKKFWNTIVKMLEASLIIVCSHYIDFTIFKSVDLKLVEITSGAIVGTEFWSMFESLSDLYPKGPWRILRKYIKKKGEKYLDITINDTDITVPTKHIRKIKN